MAMYGLMWVREARSSWGRFYVLGTILWWPEGWCSPAGTSRSRSTRSTPPRFCGSRYRFITGREPVGAQSRPPGTSNEIQAHIFPKSLGEHVPCSDSLLVRRFLVKELPV